MIEQRPFCYFKGLADKAGQKPALRRERRTGNPAAGAPRNFCQKTFEKPIDADAGFVVYAPHRMGV
ncbi:hypothetical protein [Ensifer sp. WSM1721]|uniref:hypothetical protein n=1 Tax=Ensifer sp. WSM1721 TaxID=1041159 RepID=UPI00047E569B|nr:hypothetical protein [Ensifer sp. WSM1721]